MNIEKLEVLERVVENRKEFLNIGDSKRNSIFVLLSIYLIYQLSLMLGAAHANFMDNDLELRLIPLAAITIHLLVLLAALLSSAKIFQLKSKNLYSVSVALFAPLPLSILIAAYNPVSESMLLSLIISYVALLATSHLISMFIPLYFDCEGLHSTEAIEEYKAKYFRELLVDRDVEQFKKTNEEELAKIFVEGLFIEDEKEQQEYVEKRIDELFEREFK